MKQHKFYPDKQQHNNAKLFPVYVLEVEEVENWNMILIRPEVIMPALF